VGLKCETELENDQKPNTLILSFIKRMIYADAIMTRMMKYDHCKVTLNDESNDAPDVIFEVLCSKPKVVPSQDTGGEEAAEDTDVPKKRKRGDE
jgi:hypothetical protein